MFTYLELTVAANNAISIQNTENKRWIELLNQLELTQRNLLTFYASPYFTLENQSSYSYYYQGSAEPEFIELLEALNNLKKLKTEDQNTLLNDLINDYLANSVELAHTIIEKSYNHLQGNWKTNLVKLTDTVNKTAALVTAIKKEGDVQAASAALINSADDMQETLSGPLYVRSAALATLLTIGVFLIGAAMFASPFILPLLGFGMVGIALAACLVPIPSISIMGICLVIECEIIGNMKPNSVVDQATQSVKKFAQNPAGLFAPKAMIANAVSEVEIQDMQRSVRAA
ncbi:MAG: hypothetical protein V4501_10025 [Pseudomonadota bacterium]